MIIPAAAGPGPTPPAWRLNPPALEAPAPARVALGSDVLTFTSVGNALTTPLGTVQLSATFAAFEQYKGHMTLEFIDVLPDFAGYRIASEFLAGAQVYRVSNAEEYFLDNPTICGGKPIKFVVTKLTSLEDIKNGPAASVNLLLLSLDDYKEFRPTMLDPCGGDTYTTPRIHKS